MESLSADYLNIVELLPVVLLIPLIPLLASSLVVPMGCPLDFTLMVLYMVYGIYYSINVDGLPGVLRFGAGFVGMVTVTVLCLPDPDDLSDAWSFSKPEVMTKALA